MSRPGGDALLCCVKNCGALTGEIRRRQTTTSWHFYSLWWPVLISGLPIPIGSWCIVNFTRLTKYHLRQLPLPSASACAFTTTGSALPFIHTCHPQPMRRSALSCCVLTLQPARLEWFRRHEASPTRRDHHERAASLAFHAPHLSG